MAKAYAADPERARKKALDRHRANRDAATKRMREYYGRRFFWGRAMKLRGEGRATAKDLASIWKRQRGRCALTGARLDRTAQVDHILPKARGGGDRPENLRWTTKVANEMRRHMTDAEFVAMCDSVIRWIGKQIIAATVPAP